MPSSQHLSLMVAGSRETTPSNSHQSSPIRMPQEKSLLAMNGICHATNDSSSSSTFHHELHDDVDVDVDVDENDDDEDDDDDDDDNDPSTTIALVSTVCCCYSWLEYMWDAFGLPKLYQLLANWKILTYGQVLSLMLAAGGAAQSALYVNCHLNTPTTFTLSFVYFFLSLHLIPIYFSSKRKMALVPTNDNDEQSSRQKPKSQVHGRAAFDDSFAKPSLQHRNGDENGDATRTDLAEEQFDGSIPNRRTSMLEGPAWAYFAMAVLDVEANYFTVLAFQYTTLTSVTLFDALAIPSSMILSRMFLQRRYTNFHLFGVLLCMIGVLVNVFQDYDSDNGGSAVMVGNATDPMKRNDGGTELPHKLRGDILAITGGILYGFNDFLCELSVRHLGGPEEFLGMMGFFAVIVSSIQAWVLERHQIVSFWNAIVHQHHSDRFLLPEEGIPPGIDESSSAVMCSGTVISMVWIFYVFISVWGYIGAARFLMISEAAFYNLSLLTGDLWSVAFSIVDERILPQPLFYLAFVLITGGVVLYETAPSPIQEEHQTPEQQEATATPTARRKRDKRKTSMLRLIDTPVNEDENGDLEMSATARRINHLREVA